MSLLAELIARLTALIEQNRQAEAGLLAAHDRLQGALRPTRAATAGSSNALVDDGLAQWESALEKLSEARALISAGDQAMTDYITGPLLGGTASTSGGGGSSRSTGGPFPTPRSSPAAGPTHTKPSHPPDPGRRPGNEPAPRSKPEKQGDIRSENDAAGVLARAGYEIEQNPPPKPNGKNPDYFIEGDYWDCYTVRTNNPERVRKSIKDKANPKSGNVQADRIILNFDGADTGTQTSLTPDVIEALLQRKPIAGLKEVKVIKDGHVLDLDLEG